MTRGGGRRERVESSLPRRHRLWLIPAIMGEESVQLLAKAVG